MAFSADFQSNSSFKARSRHFEDFVTLKIFGTEHTGSIVFYFDAEQASLDSLQSIREAVNKAELHVIEAIKRGESRRAENTKREAA